MEELREYGQQLFDQLGDNEQKAAVKFMELLTSRNPADKERAGLIVSASKLQDPMRRIMLLRLIDGLRWSEIARKEGYSERQIYNIRRQALALLRAESAKTGRV